MVIDCRHGNFCSHGATLHHNRDSCSILEVWRNWISFPEGAVSRGTVPVVELSCGGSPREGPGSPCEASGIKHYTFYPFFIVELIDGHMCWRWWLRFGIPYIDSYSWPNSDWPWEHSQNGLSRSWNLAPPIGPNEPICTHLVLAGYENPFWPARDVQDSLTPSIWWILERREEQRQIVPCSGVS